jgi:hypothetical protein
MPTVAELTMAEELRPLKEVADQKSWQLELVGPTTFRLLLPAKDGSQFQLEVDCSDYPSDPPAWHWRNPKSGALDQPADTPTGGGYFHGSGAICAPWNRLAYTSRNPKGPHGEWDIGHWRANPQTTGTSSLTAMALRISVELSGSTYNGRMA